VQDIDKVSDPIMKAAIITQISNYGQAPKQLFNKPHPPRRVKPPQVSETVYSSPEKLSTYALYSIQGNPFSIRIYRHDAKYTRSKKFLWKSLY
jgi:hypothetical protein